MTYVSHPDANRYLEQQISTATPAMLTAMLFDGLVAGALRALDALEAGDASNARRSLLRAQEIVLELRSALDHQAGGELAHNLDRLYEFIYHKLVRSSVSGDIAGLRVAVDIASSLRDSWREACIDQPVLMP
jgi:flagellar protein FliS